eukprot:8313350-Pyramimonas_sp.AAC.1
MSRLFNASASPGEAASPTCAPRHSNCDSRAADPGSARARAPFSRAAPSSRASAAWRRPRGRIWSRPASIRADSVAA